MATRDDVQVEVERRLRDIGARLVSLPATSKELLPLVEVSAPSEFESVACFCCPYYHRSRISVIFFV